MESKICPKCGGTVILDDTYDADFGDDFVDELHCGHCTKCGIDYQWNSYYKWMYDTDLQES